MRPSRILSRVGPATTLQAQGVSSDSSLSDSDSDSDSE